MARKTDLLGLDVEPSKRELEIMEALLKKYRTLDSDIRLNEQWANGEGLLVEPSITAQPPREEDILVLAELATQELSEGQRRIVEVVQSCVKGELGSKMGDSGKGRQSTQYITKYRLSIRIEDAQPDNEEDQRILDDFNAMLREKIGELWVDLTQTERYAIMREIPIQQARQRLSTLKMHKVAMDNAMKELKKWYPEYHEILTLRYIEQKQAKEVASELNVSESQEYRNRMAALMQLRYRLPNSMMI